MATQTTTAAASTTTDAFMATCTTAVPGKYGNVPVDACNSYYNYDPQFAPAVAVAVLFGVLTLAHLALAILFKKRYCWIIIMGATWETVSFITAALGSRDQQNGGYATAHQLLFLLAPLWINTFVYMTFARMVHFFLPARRVWRVKGASLAKYFVWFEVVAFLVQATGGLMASPGAGANTIKIGIDVYMGGIGLQEAFILFFIGLMIKFHREALQLERSGMALRERSWRPLLYALYGVLVAITVRIVYRIAEYAPGITPSNKVIFNEAYPYALDAFPMMVAILLTAVFHPGRTLVGPESEFPRLSRKEKKALKKEQKAEKKAKKEAARQERGGRWFGRSGKADEYNSDISAAQESQEYVLENREYRV